MFGLFRKNDRETDEIPGGPSKVTVLKKTRPGECGGTDATMLEDAPKEILSEKMTLFDVTSALSRNLPEKAGEDPGIGFVSAFAARASEGVFLFLETALFPRRHAEKNASWAYVRNDVFPNLVTLVRECGLAKRNGFHSTTHGLPENFGGSIDVRYESGERISISNNQTPVIADGTGRRIAAVFSEAMQGERVALPDTAKLREIRFSEERKNGGFTGAVLTFRNDGTGRNHKTSRYDDPTVYESEKAVDAETVAAIRKNVDDTGILAWSGLPERTFSTGAPKHLTFLFEDGTEITVDDRRIVPDQLRNGFFNIELEMTAKH